ncbi:ankyrin repeat and SAM domain-containing protein 6-like [Culicoides brevitarsis]|uniref:ankyrin repeat and SAM domain-containing protein 6-like n=1 Tax=Culicoides brevitarsis TaxID=469753 RepID=UPI00307B551D
MANTSFKSSPITPMLGISESFFHGSPFNSSNDSLLSVEWRKKTNNLNTRTFSPGSRFVKSPNISPIIKKIGKMTIAEEPAADDSSSSISSCDKTFTINANLSTDAITASPQTPTNGSTFVITHNYRKNAGIAKQMTSEREKAHKRRTMFLLPPTPTTIRDNNKLNTSDFEHKFTVDTILKEIGMTKFINLFESEEINIAAFLTLDDNDLISIGIMDPDERREIIKAVETYQFLK